jgi:hypothetical protein
MKIPAVYGPTTPSPVQANLSPLQLALLNYMYNGTPPPLTVNTDFLNQMQIFSDTKPLSPATLAADGSTVVPALAPGLIGLGYITLNDALYLVQMAPNCGPNGTNQYENKYIGSTSKIAKGSFTYWGGGIEGGTLSSGGAAYVYDGGGGDC